MRRTHRRVAEDDLANKQVELLESISAKLDRLIGIFSVQGQSEDDQIKTLRKLGFDWAFIGGVVGIEPDAARKRHERRKKGS